MEQEICLANLHEKTAREVFDYISRHLLTQNEKAVAPCSHRCVYRTSDGLRCAAGCLIAPSEYKKDFEEKNWVLLVSRWQFPTAHMGLITALQGLHDTWRPDQWPEKLAGVEKRFFGGLTYEKN
jgi:hypothetical protein